jgi:hypothetical protein
VEEAVEEVALLAGRPEVEDLLVAEALPVAEVLLAAAEAAEMVAEVAVEAGAETGAEEEGGKRRRAVL